MAKCAACGQRKAKRTCPVLGSLCTLCCGQKRRREIVCHVDCRFLDSEVGAALEAYQRAAEKLRDFALGNEATLAKKAAEVCPATSHVAAAATTAPRMAGVTTRFGVERVMTRGICSVRPWWLSAAHPLLAHGSMSAMPTAKG